MLRFEHIRLPTASADQLRDQHGNVELPNNRFDYRKTPGQIAGGYDIPVADGGELEEAKTAQRAIMKIAVAKRSNTTRNVGPAPAMGARRMMPISAKSRKR